MVTTEAPRVRKAALWAFTIAVVTMLFAFYVGLVYHGDLDAGASWVAAIEFWVWVLIFSLILGTVLLVLIFLFFAVPARGAPGESLVSVQCQNCSTAFDVVDSGDRPLYYSCPQCGAEDVLPGPAAEPGEVPTPAVSASEDALLVKCQNCEEVFELPFTEKRPVYGNCPKCGRRGVLPAPRVEGGVPLLDIEGIGPTYAEKLGDAGIANTEQLRTADLDAVAVVTEIPKGMLASWRSMADLLRVKGIGPQYAEVLARAGIETVDDLARQDPKDLAARVQDYLESLETNVMGAGVDEKRARSWVRAARELHA